MPRNFGIRRNHFGAELFRDFWHANDNEPEARWPIVLVCAAVVLMAAMGIALARDDGRYANSPLKPWFDHLASGKGLCCSIADGETVADVDWDSRDGHYRVHLRGNWIDVPDDAVITEPNLFGRTMVWPTSNAGTQEVIIRCFMPGSMT
jgi:hypothetical protein